MPIRLPGASLALLIWTVPTGVAALPAPQEQFASAPSDRASIALKLAQLVEPKEVLANSPLLEAQFIQGMLSDPDGKSMEAEYPGITRAIWRASEQELMRQTLATLPDYWGKLAAVYNARMTMEEIEAACAFFASDVGRKVIKLKSEAMIAQVAKIVVQSDAGVLSKDSFAQGNDNATETAVAGLSHNEQLFTAAFGLSPAGAKMKQLGPDIQAVTLQWMNESNAEDDAKLDAIMTDAIGAHIEAIEANRRER